MTQITRTRLDPFISCCVGRSDDYAFQLQDGRYLRAGTKLTYDDLFAHLQGRYTLGTYVITEHNLCHFAVFDSDAPAGLFDLASLQTNLATSGNQWHPILSGTFAAWCSPVGFPVRTNLTRACACLAPALLSYRYRILSKTRGFKLGASWLLDPLASRCSPAVW